MFIKAFTILFFLTSCASFKKTMITSAISGGVIGAVGGNVFSPDKASAPKNAYLFGMLGSIAGLLIAYNMRPEKAKVGPKNSLLLDNKYLQKEVPLFDFSPQLKDIRPEVTFNPVKKYEVPLEKLPKALEGKAKKQYIIEYEAEARTLEIGNRTIEISPFKAWEHLYEE